MCVILYDYSGNGVDYENNVVNGVFNGNKSDFSYGTANSIYYGLMAKIARTFFIGFVIVVENIIKIYKNYYL